MVLEIFGQAEGLIVENLYVWLVVSDRSSNSEYILLPNTTQTTDFVDQTSNNSTEMIKETGNKPGEVNTEMPGSINAEWNFSSTYN